MSQKKIFVATPMFGGQCYGGYASSLLSLSYAAQRRDVPVNVFTLYNESLIPRARNKLVHQFLKTDSTHLMFIDADIEFNPNDIFAMLEAGVDVIGGVYPMKSINWNNVANAAQKGVPAHELHFFSAYQNVNTLDNKVCEVTDVNAPLEVKHAPTGFLLIKREVFEKLAQHTPKIFHNEMGVVPFEYSVFFDCSIDGNDYLSEDWHFCNLWRSAGGKVHVAPWVTLKHFGTYAFSGGPYVA